MSEQLNLLGEIEAPKKKSKPRKPKAEDTSLSDRIQNLINEKGRMDLLPAKVEAPAVVATPVAAGEVSVPAPAPTPKEPAVVREPAAAKEPEVLTVTDLNKAIKGLLEKNYPFLWVKGEISNCKTPSSGHMYFTLKDQGAQIRAVMFRGFAQQLKFKPEDGMEVLVRCRVTVYEPRGDYQLFCEVMEPVGYGALQVAFEKLKKQLQGEGLFDLARKKQLPAFPQRIAIITSPTGAAIRDMINVLSRRSGGGIEIMVLPTAVQGDKAPSEIAKAIDLVSRLGTARFDVCIVGRGGGSLEDLWAFNTEEVARAVSHCGVPTISAVGHEVDFTICDFVADLRAPTPSAAAELVVKNKADLAERVALLKRQLVQQMRKKWQLAQAQIQGLSKRLVDPKRRLQDLMLRADEWSDRLLQSIDRYIKDSRMHVALLGQKLGSPAEKLQQVEHRLERAQQSLGQSIKNILDRGQNRFAQLGLLLNGLSPLAVLDRGYAIARRGSEILKQSQQVNVGDQVTVKLSQGEIETQVTGVKSF